MEVVLRSLAHTGDHPMPSVLITDPQGAIEYVNARFTELTGYTAREVEGRTPSFLQAANFSAETYQDLWRTLEAGEVWEGEFNNKRRNGERYWEAGTIAPFRDAHGAIAGYVAIREDITARKQAEAALRPGEAPRPQGLDGTGLELVRELDNLLTTFQCSADVLNLHLEPDSAVRLALEAMFKAGCKGKELGARILEFSRNQRSH